jgi:hypothetical protein
MYLDRQVLCSVEELDEEWKAAVRRGRGDTQEFVAVECAKFSQRSTVERPAKYGRLPAFDCYRQIREFPCFTDGFADPLVWERCFSKHS